METAQLPQYYGKDQAEKAARRMSVYPIKGGLGDRDAPTTPFKSPFKSGGHMREFTSATPGAVQTLSPSRLGDLYQNCIKLSNENVSFCSSVVLLFCCNLAQLSMQTAFKTQLDLHFDNQQYLSHFVSPSVAENQSKECFCPIAS